MQIDPIMFVTATIGSALAAALLYAGSSRQRIFARPLPVFPTRVSAAMAAMVGAAAWWHAFTLHA